MRRTFCFLLLTLSLARNARAQAFTERVYLTDSVTVYEGLIIEQAPSKYVKILRRAQKDTVTVPLNQIWKLTKDYPAPDTTAPKPKAQPGRRTQVAYVEVLGAGGVNSINYDTRISTGGRNGWGVRAGIGYWKVPTISYYADTLRQGLISLPLMVNYLVGRRTNFLELGLGVTYFLCKPEHPYEGPKDQYTIQEVGARIPSVLGSFMIGFRHVPLKRGFVYGFTLNPLVGKSFTIPDLGTHLNFVPSIGIKLGWKWS
ncbi:hypothetical protein [Flaviaesturariibacter terrae]